MPPAPPFDLLAAVRKLRVYQRGDRRAPHKPLLLLLALSELEQGKEVVPFEKIREKMVPLLKAFAPPVRGAPQAELPYWHLQSDGLWVIPGADRLDRQHGGFPRIDALKRTSGHLAEPVLRALEMDPALRDRVVQALLDDHFPPSLHGDILEMTGLDLHPVTEPLLASDVAVPPKTRSSARDPEFRNLVLQAYEHRCAVTGFRAALCGTYLGVEAAHIRWHCCEGPDIVANGIVLEPMLHLLFDRGAWSLTDDRRVLVSKDLTGEGDHIERLRSLHGKPLRSPLPGYELPKVEFIRWHREKSLGGIFRAPVLGQVALPPAV